MSSSVRYRCAEAAAARVLGGLHRGSGAEGLIELKRTLDDVAVISAESLERVRFITLLTEELEVNLPGAEVILHMRDDMIAMQRQFEEILATLVDELKPARRARGGD